MGFIDRKGDSGNTKLLTGETVRKDHPVTEAIGACEELLSHLCAAKAHNDRFKATIVRFQTSLMIILDVLSSMGKIEYAEIDKENHLLNVLVEEYHSDLKGKIDYKVVLDTNVKAAELYVARAVCRRFERRLVSLLDVMEVDKKILKYVNRLSDIILLMAIFTEKGESFKEY